MNVPSKIFHVTINTLISGPLGMDRYKSWVETSHVIIAESYTKVPKDWVKIGINNYEVLETPNIFTAIITSYTVSREEYIYGPPDKNAIIVNRISNFENFIMQSYNNEKVYFYPSWSSYPCSSFNNYRP